MATPNRRIDLGRDFYNLQLIHRAKSEASVSADFADIGGNTEDNAELNEKLDDLEVLAALSNN